MKVACLYGGREGQRTAHRVPRTRQQKGRGSRWSVLPTPVRRTPLQKGWGLPICTVALCMTVQFRVHFRVCFLDASELSSMKLIEILKPKLGQAIAKAQTTIGVSPQQSHESGPSNLTDGELWYYLPKEKHAQLAEYYK